MAWRSKFLVDFLGKHHFWKSDLSNRLQLHSGSQGRTAANLAKQVKESGRAHHGAARPTGTRGFTPARKLLSVTDSLPMPISLSMPVVKESIARWWRIELTACA